MSKIFGVPLIMIALVVIILAPVMTVQALMLRELYNLKDIVVEEQIRVRLESAAMKVAQPEPTPTATITATPTPTKAVVRPTVGSNGGVM